MKKLVFLFAVLTLGVVSSMNGQSAKFKALFLYNFSLNVDWPSNGSDTEVVFTVLGDDDVKSELEAIAKVKKVGSKTMVIKGSPSVKEIGDTHVVFLGATKSSLMPLLESYQKDKPVLIVGDKSGLCKQGAGISFVTMNGKMKFEICPAMIEQHNIKVSQKIINLGLAVQ